MNFSKVKKCWSNYKKWPNYHILGIIRIFPKNSKQSINVYNQAQFHKNLKDRFREKFKIADFGTKLTHLPHFGTRIFLKNSKMPIIHFLMLVIRERDFEKSSMLSFGPKISHLPPFRHNEKFPKKIDWPCFFICSLEPNFFLICSLKPKFLLKKSENSPESRSNISFHQVLLGTELNQTWEKEGEQSSWNKNWHINEK